MKIRMILTVILITALLAACGGNNSTDSPHEIETTEELKTLINDYSTGEFSDETASITSTELIISNNDEKESIYKLPEDEFFVSIAPFINETHPCTIHSLTGCQGELVDADFDFHIEDMDGNVIIEDTFNSEANGFIDLWLPRDETFIVKVTYEDTEVTSEISTFKEDGTCITTMQLM